MCSPHSYSTPIAPSPTTHTAQPNAMQHITNNVFFANSSISFIDFYFLSDYNEVELLDSRCLFRSSGFFSDRFHPLRLSPRAEHRSIWRS